MNNHVPDNYCKFAGVLHLLLIGDFLGSKFFERKYLKDVESFRLPIALAAPLNAIFTRLLPLGSGSWIP